MKAYCIILIPFSSSLFASFLLSRPQRVRHSWTMRGVKRASWTQTKRQDSDTLQLRATSHCGHCPCLHYICFVSETCCSVVVSFGDDLSLDSALLVFDNGKCDRLRPSRREGGTLADYLCNRNAVRLFEINRKMCMTEFNFGILEDPKQNERKLRCVIFVCGNITGFFLRTYRECSWQNQF